jgi:ATPase
MIPSVLDTVVFVERGEVGQVLELSITVKVPTGMIEADLARPVVEVRDFITKKILYEMYSYGEETVVVPISKTISKPRGLTRIAEDHVRSRIQKGLRKGEKVKVEAVTNGSVRVYASKNTIPHIIGKEGKHVQELESKLGVKIDVRDDLEESVREKGEKKSYTLKETKQYFVFEFGRKTKGHNYSFFSGDEFVFDGIVGKKGQIKVAKKSELGERVKQLLKHGELEVFD